MLGFLLCLSAPHAGAEIYPVRPIRLIVGFPAGGSTDLMARTVGEKLSERKGWRIVIENRPGASGMIAAEATAKAAPDGYLLLMAPDSTFTVTPHLSKMVHDPMESLVPIIQVAIFQGVIVTYPDFPVKNLEELLLLARAKPGVLNFGSLGIGTAFHLSGEIINHMAGVSMVHVPYQGFGLASAAILGRHLDLFINTVGTMKGLIGSGKLKPLAVTGSKRYPLLPDVPTIAETLPGYEVFTGMGFFAPKGTPLEIVRRLNAEITAVLSGPAAVKVWEENHSASFVPNRPEEYISYLKKESERYGVLVKKLGLKLE